jgi:hypothetical protein
MVLESTLFHYIIIYLSSGSIARRERQIQYAVMLYFVWFHLFIDIQFIAKKKLNKSDKCHQGDRFK